MLMGSHVKLHNSSTAAELIGADIIQCCFGSPRSWHSTLTPRNPHHTMTIHAPYLVNLSSSQQRVFDLSVETLMDQGKAAEDYDVRGLVFHGGSYKKGSREQALKQWEEGVWEYNRKGYAPLFVENAAAGRFSLTRTTKDIADLWEVAGCYGCMNFCLDTAHLWAAIGKPQEAATFIKELRQIVGHIPMVHANGSGVSVGGGMDKHAPLEISEAPAEWVAWCIRLARPDMVITETTAPAQDLVTLRQLLTYEGDCLD